MPLSMTYQTRRAKVGTLELDATVSQEHTRTAAVSAHPVERGAEVVDHIRPEPDALTLEGVVTNTPIPAAERQRMGAPDEGIPGRAEVAFAILEDLHARQALVTVDTALCSYTDMAIVSMRFPRAARLGDTLHFSLSLRKVRLVQNQTAKILRHKASTTRAKDEANTGKQVAEKAPEPVRGLLSALTGIGEKL